MEIENKVKKALLAHGITEPVKNVAVKDPGLRGEGFASQSKYIQVEFQNSDVPPMNLFAKVVTQSESHTQMLDEMKAFEKESTFLTRYVSAADEMCRKKGCEGSSELYPKCYYGDSRIVILENLVLDKGYCLLDKSERQDFNAACFALKTLAKHHAISYAMIREEGGPASFFQKFQHLDYECFDKPHFYFMMGPALKNALRTNLKLLENNIVEGREDAIKILKPFNDVSLMSLLLSTLKCKDDELLVLNHGDYWNNNMMFIKNEANQVIGHKAIDLQVTRYNSVALDLTYFMFTSVKTNVRISHLEELLKTYLDTLLKVSGELGHPISLTYEQLFQGFREKLNYGFWFAMCMVIGPGMQAMKDLDMNKVDIKDFAKVMDDLIQKWIAKNPQYSKVIAEELVQLAYEYKRLTL